MNNKTVVVVLSAVALLLAFYFGARAFRDQRSDTIEELAQEHSPTLVAPHAMSIGNPDARVVIVEFFDPACETCASFYPMVKGLMAQHPDRLRLVMRYAPFHEGSDMVVKMLEATREQDLYEVALKQMYDTQPFWASHHAPQPEMLWRFLAQVGVDLEELQTAMQSPDLDALVQQDLADAEILGVRKTPSFFVNGKPLVTFGWEPLVALVEGELAVQYPGG